jgi:hypothetical protein
MSRRWTLFGSAEAPSPTPVQYNEVHKMEKKSEGVLAANPWLEGTAGEGPYVVVPPREVNAPAERVFALVCALERYEAMSGGQAVARCERLEDGATVTVGLRPKSIGGLKRFFLGSSLGESVERVLMPAGEMALGWTRQMPMSSDFSFRWQVVEPLGAERCRLLAGLMLPNSLARYLTGSEIAEAFEALAAGIKEEAEKES